MKLEGLAKSLKGLRLRLPLTRNIDFQTLGNEQGTLWPDCCVKAFHIKYCISAPNSEQLR